MLKIFTAEFYSIGALFAVYGAGVLAVGGYRRSEGNKIFFVVSQREGEREGTELRTGRDGGAAADGVDGSETAKNFRTSGNVVVVLTVLSVMAYATMLVLTLRLRDTDRSIDRSTD